MKSFRVLVFKENGAATSNRKLNCICGLFLCVSCHDIFTGQNTDIYQLLACKADTRLITALKSVIKSNFSPCFRLKSPQNLYSSARAPLFPKASFETAAECSWKQVIFRLAASFVIRLTQECQIQAAIQSKNLSNGNKNQQYKINCQNHKLAFQIPSFYHAL